MYPRPKTYKKHGKRSRRSPSKRRSDNIVVRFIQEFMSILNDVNNITHGAMYTLIGVYGFKFIDFLWEKYKKSKNDAEKVAELMQEINELEKKLDNINDKIPSVQTREEAKNVLENKNSITRDLLAKNDEYKKMTKKSLLKNDNRYDRVVKIERKKRPSMSRIKTSEGYISSGSPYMSPLEMRKLANAVSLELFVSDLLGDLEKLPEEYKKYRSIDTVLKDRDIFKRYMNLNNINSDDDSFIKPRIIAELNVDNNTEDDVNSETTPSRSHSDSHSHSDSDHYSTPLAPHNSPQKKRSALARVLNFTTTSGTKTPSNTPNKVVRSESEFGRKKSRKRSKKRSKKSKSRKRSKKRSNKKTKNRKSKKR